MLLFGGENKLAVNRLPLIRQGKALPPSPRGEGLRQRSLPRGEGSGRRSLSDRNSKNMRKANKTFKTLYFRGGM